MSYGEYFTFIVASILLVIVPGPTVTVIVANSLRAGTKAGLANIAGTQFGLILMMLVVAFSLESVVTIMAHSFFWLKLAGAGYLIWLGINLLRSKQEITLDDGRSETKPPKAGYFWQGFLVIWSNPKALLLFGAFIPQFVSSAEDAFVQTMQLGLIFMVIATVFDCIYAFLAGSAGAMLTKNRVRLVEKISGSFLIGGGLWLASLRQN